MKITYTRVGDYYLPNLVAPESPKVGRWGMLRFNYLRKHRESLYTIMLMEDTLTPIWKKLTVRHRKWSSTLFLSWHSRRVLPSN